MSRMFDFALQAVSSVVPAIILPLSLRVSKSAGCEICRFARVHANYASGSNTNIIDFGG